MSARTSRNIEHSLKAYLVAQLELAEWDNVTVIFRDKDVYADTLTLPIITVKLSDTEWLDGEIGSNLLERNPLLLIEIHAKSEGQRLDLKDTLIPILRSGFPYYSYTIASNEATQGAQDGYCTMASGTKITDKEVNLGIDKSSLVQKDRYRHLITMVVSRGRLE